MGFKDTFGFSSKTYRKHLQDDYSDDQLKRKHHQKTLLKVSTGIAASSAFVGGCLLVVPFLGFAYALRQSRVLQRQTREIEKELEEREMKIPKTRARDVIGGVAIGVVTAGVGWAVPIGLDALTGQVAQEAVNSAFQAGAAVVPEVAVMWGEWTESQRCIDPNPHPI